MGAEQEWRSWGSKTPKQPNYLEIVENEVASDQLSGPISRDIAILSLRYPISRDTFSGRLALPQNGAIPPLVLSFTQAHLCDTPFCNISRDNCAIPHKTSTKELCDTIAASLARYEKYRCWASKVTRIQRNEKLNPN